jgi:enoyl-CoA hydratase/carnithine racemase
MDEARRLGLLYRTAPAEQAEAAALELARELATFPPAGMRQLKRMFRELEGTERRVAWENELLVDFQREGSGLPRRG